MKTLTISQIILGLTVIYKNNKLIVLDKNIGYDLLLLESPNGKNDKPIWVDLSDISLIK
jgi:hypothetical protein